MASMRDQFQHFYAPDEDDIATAIKTGLVAPDTNVVLHLYRFQAEARDELFGALEKLDNRLWIPHQVGLEFHRNRLGVMAEQEGYFAQTRSEIDKVIEALYGKVRAFGRRIGMDPDRIENIADGIDMLHTNLCDEIAKAEEANEVRLDGHASDLILPRIHALFEGRVGSPMEPQELEEARAEAERRIKDRIPPGYKDNDKADPSGDYLVFRQLMNEAKERKLPVVFITDDTKPDWYEEYKGRTIGARRELREEMARGAGVPLFIMTTRTFLLRAKDDLNAKVSPSTVEQAKELPFPHIQPVRDGGSVTPENMIVLTDASNHELASLVGNLDAWQLGRLSRLAKLWLVTNKPEEVEAERKLLADFLRESPTDSQGEIAARRIANILTSSQSSSDDARRALDWWLMWYLPRRAEPRSEQDQPED